MKRLIVLIVPLLASCTVFDAVVMTKYDSNEYRIISEIRTDASVYSAACSNTMLSQANAEALANKTLLFQPSLFMLVAETFSFYIVHM